MAQNNMRLQRKIIKELKLDYLLYTPDDYHKDTVEKWPLIVFLHGSGECGSELDRVKSHGIPKVVEDAKLPFITVSPQCPDFAWEKYFDELYELILYLIENYNIDINRIYLTGLSMGGYGVWNFSMLHPKLFAAIAPVCGGSSYVWQVEAIKCLPIWAFHGAKDEAVPITESQVLVNELKKLGSDVRYTIYPEGTHDVWTETYANPELYKWFLKHNRNEIIEMK